VLELLQKIADIGDEHDIAPPHRRWQGQNRALSWSTTPIHFSKIG